MAEGFYQTQKRFFDNKPKKKKSNDYYFSLVYPHSGWKLSCIRRQMEKSKNLKKLIYSKIGFFTLSTDFTALTSQLSECVKSAWRLIPWSNLYNLLGRKTENSRNLKTVCLGIARLVSYAHLSDNPKPLERSFDRL
ncbi:hypothetical protein B9Q13_02520 [Candidatus Marsarchaeota G2 archaeon ECH_B_SAG-G16]|uniref:Uncharacterized protein n=5 Tax=Candidatus Marsarchaeota TaxID=1978152 RepID=A0A2R6AKE8_9ARCH|nr:MAG: hypothetical protein B9Q01_00985 [Candidatus Marsarchaeota G1 archaeon OSP_D]PSN86838.1 MAG: hypothetical protein B9Q02_00010 [Candidatus Marsarchaeota G1 archaeon BE_D]PSN88669.1 MAG: hypothetical protein B9P99_05790 [Candidatus Marsarchaeota G1 archaeon OSP_B]PSN89134.1 MAG: hypothetical protein B9Q00_02620 [Candidatus Marsarchaeota G1 archaeon OSP_C]PSO05203.1 MAG: hypothetical protein B9Q13_02520 [Candidatus Marsarchaeota G2 archaeon ECH_B_SAG-G16]